MAKAAAGTFSVLFHSQTSEMTAICYPLRKKQINTGVSGGTVDRTNSTARVITGGKFYRHYTFRMQRTNGVSLDCWNRTVVSTGAAIQQLYLQRFSGGSCGNEDKIRS